MDVGSKNASNCIIFCEYDLQVQNSDYVLNQQPKLIIFYSANLIAKGAVLNYY